MTKEKNVLAYLAWATICVIWGTTYLAIRIGVKDLPPILFAGLRAAIAGPILFVFLRLRGYALPKKEDLIHLTFIGLALISMGNGLVVFSEKYLSSGLAALLVTTVPFWIVGFEAVMPHGKKLNINLVGGLILGLAGVVLIFGFDLSSLLKSDNLIGVISIMLAEVGWSAGSVYSKYKKPNVHPLMSAAYQMMAAGVFLIIAGAAAGEFSQLKITPEGLAAFVYLVIFGSLIGYSSYIYAIAHLPVSFVSTYAYINPIIALFLGWLVLGEVITINVIIAAAIILVGVMLVKKGSEVKTNG